MTPSRRLALILITLLAPTPVLASPPAMTMSTASDSDDQDIASGSDELFGSRSQSALGDMGGLRPWLSRYGTSFNIEETSEILGNVSGGTHQGFDYDGLTQMDLQTDTQAAFGWYGGTFNISALQIHGRNLSADNLQSLQTASGIEADRGLRLWELWYQQKFLDEDRMDVKIGEQSLDTEFMTSQNASLFVNTMFGWPMLPSADMPDGGPAYPLSALGVRVRGRPDNSFTILGGVFNGSPANKSGVNDSGTGFPLDGGTLAIAEIQYAYPALGAMVSPDQGATLSGTYKLGFWYDSEDFADMHYDATGQSLANPAGTGDPRMHHGDYGIYAVADQMLWHSEQFDNRSLNIFGRAMGTPQADRNLVNFSLNAGLTLNEPLPRRDDDTIGIGMGYANVSSAAAALDRDAALYSPGTYTPVRGGETFVEATYQYQITPWWQLQPDVQYVFNPGAGVADANAPGQRVGDEAVIGLRTNILF
ncbi:MAG: carbohydrate porin [Alphaproteobacteria bacterium]|nr:carbohydrate porin [Alphaproteobacteria bacterium]